MILLLTQMVFFKRFTCFFKLAEEAYLEQNEPFSTLKTKILGSIPFKNKVNSPRETMC
jgi:hypothetical protein